MEKKKMQCSVCKTIAKSHLYICESGHVICNNCQNSDDAMKNYNQGGDFEAEKLSDAVDDMNKLQVIDLEAKPQDLASGDHEIDLASQNTSNEVKKNSKENDISLTFKDPCSKSFFETSIEYKNPYFNDNKSSVSGSADCANTTEIKEDNMPTCNVVARPVVCPVTNCSKMVAIDSIMLHFHFDHSKVSRTTLDDVTPQEVFLKSTNFSTDVQCVATFIIETQKTPTKPSKKRLDPVNTVRNTLKDTKLLLLMAVILPTNPIKLLNMKRDTPRTFTRSIHTQTEKINDITSGVSSECLSKTSSDYKSCTSKFVHDDDEVLLLWLCKLDDADKVFSITLLGEDKRRGYCYIGDAAHVREKQDPTSLHERSECLIVKASTVNSLYDMNGQITAIVSIIG